MLRWSLIITGGVCLGVLGPPAWAQAAEQPAIVVREVRVDTGEGEAVGLVATIDLSRVEVVVTPAADASLPEGADAVLTPTDAFANEHGLDLAINANFFGLVGDRKTTLHADILGLNISDGVVVSPPRTFGDPAIVFSRDGKAAVGRFTTEALKASDAFNAVAGIGPSETDATLGGLLVHDGENLGASARVQPLRRHPRTAIGVDATGTRIVLAVIDGRRPFHSVGMKLPELAQVMIDAGCDDAIALDGGGSSAIVVKPQWAPDIDQAKDGYDDGWVSNRPSDGKFRAVANNIGFRLLEQGNTQTPPASQQ